jgi:xylose isomerase
MSVFESVDRVRYEGPENQSIFAFACNDADRMLPGGA